MRCPSSLCPAGLRRCGALGTRAGDPVQRLRDPTLQELPPAHFAPLLASGSTDPPDRDIAGIVVLDEPGAIA